MSTLRIDRSNFDFGIINKWEILLEVVIKNGGRNLYLLSLIPGWIDPSESINLVRSVDRISDESSFDYSFIVLSYQMHVRHRMFFDQLVRIVACHLFI